MESPPEHMFKTFNTDPLQNNRQESSAYKSLAIDKKNIRSKFVFRSFFIWTAIFIITIAFMALHPNANSISIGEFFEVFLILVIPGSVILTILTYFLAIIFLNQKLHNTIVQKIKEEISQIGLEVNVAHDWKEPAPTVFSFTTPALFSLDTKNKLIHVNSEQTEHLHLFIPIKYILALKVERNLDIHTSTSPSARVHIPIGDNISYSVGGGTTSKSSITEHPVLEMHYQLPEDTLPKWINIPFEDNRQKAESIILAINRLIDDSPESKNV